MTYRESLHIGSSAEGIIKCTYATLYSKDGKPLFSLQRKSAKKKIVYGPDFDGDQIPDTISFDGEVKHEVVEFGKDYYTDGSIVTDEEKGFIYFDLPMVQADSISKERLVPAYITQEAVEIFRAAMEKMRTRRYRVYRIYDEDCGPGFPKGTRRLVQTYYDVDANRGRWEDTEKMHYETEVDQVANPKYEKLIEIITNGDPVYIKPGAFEWYALDVKNATVVTKDEDGNDVEINLNVAIEEAQKKMENAKAVLIGAGLSNLL